MENGLDIIDANVLYDAFLASKMNSKWKLSTRSFEYNLLKNLYDIKKELSDMDYITSPGIEFIQRERGKERPITGNQIRDRIVRHALCDNIINPKIERYLIYDNGASIKGKGISFSRERFEHHLHKFCRDNGSNEGYILFGDFSKYYDNIQHQKLLELYGTLFDDYTMWLIRTCLLDSRIDVSYMADEEFSGALAKKFDSIKYRATVPRDLLTGEKYLEKSMNIGDQLSQSSGIFYPMKIDNYVKIVRSQKYYGRYMDDFYIISKSKEELKDILEGIRIIAKEQGMFINDKKTRIAKLSSKFTFLQIKYWVTKSGHITKAINPKTIVRERRKLKKYKKKLDQGIMDYESIENAYKSWMGNYTKLMSKQQIRNMKTLYKQLFGKEPVWKKEHTQSHL